MSVEIRRMPPKSWGHLWGQLFRKEHISPPTWASLDGVHNNNPAMRISAPSNRGLCAPCDYIHSSLGLISVQFLFVYFLCLVFLDTVLCYRWHHVVTSWSQTSRRSIERVDPSWDIANLELLVWSNSLMRQPPQPLCQDLMHTERILHWIVCLPRS